MVRAIPKKASNRSSRQRAAFNVRNAEKFCDSAGSTCCMEATRPHMLGFVLFLLWMLV
jgi:hypothetical protein